MTDNDGNSTRPLFPPLNLSSRELKRDRFRLRLHIACGVTLLGTLVFLFVAPAVHRARPSWFRSVPKICEVDGVVLPLVSLASHDVANYGGLGLAFDVVTINMNDHPNPAANSVLSGAGPDRPEESPLACVRRLHLQGQYGVMSGVWFAGMLHGKVYKDIWTQDEEMYDAPFHDQDRFDVMGRRVEGDTLVYAVRFVRAYPCRHSIAGLVYFKVVPPALPAEVKRIRITFPEQLYAHGAYPKSEHHPLPEPVLDDIVIDLGPPDQSPAPDGPPSDTQPQE